MTGLRAWGGDDLPTRRTTPPAHTHRRAPYAYAAIAHEASRFVFTAEACPLDQAGATMCPGDVVGHAEHAMANLVSALLGRTVWLGFACEQHAGQLVAARALRPRDRDTLHRRRDRHRIELAGQRWAGEQEGPLARGAAAERLIERAHAWAQRHPNHPSPRPEHDATHRARSDRRPPAQ